MKVNSVSASVRFSGPAGDSRFKTVDLSADATLDNPAESWREAQAKLYRNLGQQVRSLWREGVKEEGKQERLPDSGEPNKARCCQEHRAEFLRFQKDGKVWFSHKLPDNKWRRQKQRKAQAPHCWSLRYSYPRQVSILVQLGMAMNIQRMVLAK